MKAFCSWSGGKDCALAFYKAQKNGIQIDCLFNMAGEDGTYSRSHGLKSALLNKQAEAMGIKLAQGKASWEMYEKEFKQKVAVLKKQSITAGIFGDIDLEAHREWVERVCKETGIMPFLPLWQREREALLEEFINSGFKAFICVVNSKHLDETYLGKEVNQQFIQDMKKNPQVDLCGEKGEFHTFVYGGPIFKREMQINKLNHAQKDEYFFLNIV